MSEERIATGCELIGGQWADALLRSSISSEDVERFNETVLGSQNPRACWSRGEVRDQSRYGRFRLKNGLTHPAHRVAYCLAHGDIPANRYVHHRCENRWCVNPAHLRAVTATEHNRIHGAARVRRNRAYEEEEMAARRKRYQRLVQQGKVRPPVPLK